MENGFDSKKCQIEKENICESVKEKESVLKVEQILHESDYFETLELENENFGIIANSKNEEAIIFGLKENKNNVGKDCKERITNNRELKKKFK